MKVGRKPEYPEKIPDDELQKMPHTKAHKTFYRMFSKKRKEREKRKEKRKKKVKKMVKKKTFQTSTSCIPIWAREVADSLIKKLIKKAQKFQVPSETRTRTIALVTG